MSGISDLDPDPDHSLDMVNKIVNVCLFENTDEFKPKLFRSKKMCEFYDEFLSLIDKFKKEISMSWSKIGRI